VLEVITKHTPLQLEITEQLFGGASIDAHGVPLSDETLKACKEADAILLGTWRVCFVLESPGGRWWGVGEGENVAVKGEGEGEAWARSRARARTESPGWAWVR
jgi:hypothetical protein